MQEEVENRTLTLVVSGTKFTGRLLKAAISKYMAHCKEKKLQKQRSRDAPVTPHGKQTVGTGIIKIHAPDPVTVAFLMAVAPQKPLQTVFQQDEHSLVHPILPLVADTFDGFRLPITIYLDRKAGQPVRLSFHLVPKLQ